MDIARSWAVGGVAALVPMLGFGLAAPSYMGLGLLLSAFVGALTAAALHPEPARPLDARHLLASLPPAFTVLVLGSLAMAASPSAPGLSVGGWGSLAGQALLAGMLGVALVRLGRSRTARRPT